MTVGLSTTAILATWVATSSETLRDKASNITWRYATPCLPVIDSKVNDLNDLEWLFLVKIHF